MIVLGVGSPCLGWSHGGLTDSKNIFFFFVFFAFLICVVMEETRYFVGEISVLAFRICSVMEPFILFVKSESFVGLVWKWIG